MLEGRGPMLDQAAGIGELVLRCVELRPVAVPGHRDIG